MNIASDIQRFFSHQQLFTYYVSPKWGGSDPPSPLSAQNQKFSQLPFPPCQKKSERATGPVLSSVKEEKHKILHTTLNIAVRRGKLRTYTLQKTPKVFEKFAPSDGYKEFIVVSFAQMERSSSFIKICEQNRFQHTHFSCG